jgi:tyrosine-protein kinase Etk/Wzc
VATAPFAFPGGHKLAERSSGYIEFAIIGAENKILDSARGPTCWARNHPQWSTNSSFCRRLYYQQLGSFINLNVATHTDTAIQTDPLLTEEGFIAPQAETETSLLDVTLVLVQNKRFIVRFVAGAIILAVVVSLILPVQYEATAVLLPPNQSTSLASSILGQSGGMGSVGSLGVLGALAGGLGFKTQTDTYIAFLKSRTVEDAMIQRFGLLSEYRLKRMSDARKTLESRATIAAGTKDGLIRIAVEDRNPKRAAELANGWVEEFRKLSATLAITEAARRRLFFEQQLQSEKENLTTAEEAMRKVEQTTGVMQIESQARALIESAAILRAQVTAKEVQIQGMRSFAAEDNPDLVLAKQQLAALQKQLDQLAGSQTDTGSDIVLSKGRVTQAGLEYLRRYRDLKYNETVYELLLKGLEVAKLDEAKEGEIVQVVDVAVPPDRKSSPHRTIIVLASAVLAFFFAVFWVMTRQSLRRSFALPENRRRLESIKRYWKGKPERSQADQVL